MEIISGLSIGSKVREFVTSVSQRPPQNDPNAFKS